MAHSIVEDFLDHTVLPTMHTTIKNVLNITALNWNVDTDATNRIKACDPSSKGHR